MSQDSKALTLNNPPQTTGFGVTTADGSTASTSNRSQQAAAYVNNSREAQSATANGKTKTGGRLRRRRRRRQRGGSSTCGSFSNVAPTLPSASGMAVIPDQSSQSVNNQAATSTKQQNTAMEMNAYSDQIGKPKGSVAPCLKTGTQSGGKRRTRRRWTSKPNDGPKLFSFNVGGSRRKRSRASGAGASGANASGADASEADAFEGEVNYALDAEHANMRN